MKACKLPETFGEKCMISRLMRFLLFWLQNHTMKMIILEIMTLFLDLSVRIKNDTFR